MVNLQIERSGGRETRQLWWEDFPSPVLVGSARTGASSCHKQQHVAVAAHPGRLIPDERGKFFARNAGIEPALHAP
jgi:hypothetical protein